MATLKCNYNFIIVCTSLEFIGSLNTVDNFILDFEENVSNHGAFAAWLRFCIVVLICVCLTVFHFVVLAFRLKPYRTKSPSKQTVINSLACSSISASPPFPSDTAVKIQKIN